MQGDGNVVISSPTWQPLWATSTFSPGATLRLSDDGNLSVQAPTGARLWSGR